MNTHEIKEYLQEKVNELVPALVAEYPDIAENNPEQIGKMAKDIVLSSAIAAANITALKMQS